MSRIVLDCSVVIAWAIRDNEPAERADSVIEQVLNAGGLAPAIWPLEVVNVLHVAERRGRIEPAETEGVLVRLSKVSVFIEPTPGETAFGPVLKLARSLRISAYDASYLEVALRNKPPLATFDKRLAAAATTGSTVVLAFPTEELLVLTANLA